MITEEMQISVELKEISEKHPEYLFFVVDKSMTVEEFLVGRR